jgi:hypothetical protein
VTTSLRRINRPCTLRYWAPGPPDDHNDQTDLWSEVVTVCAFQERSRMQQGGEAEIGLTLWLVFLKPAERIPMSADRIVVDGTEYNFHGDGYLSHDIRNNADHIEATVWKAA